MFLILPNRLIKRHLKYLNTTTKISIYPHICFMFIFCISYASSVFVWKFICTQCCSPTLFHSTLLCLDFSWKRNKYVCIACHVFYYQYICGHTVEQYFLQVVHRPTSVCVLDQELWKKMVTSSVIWMKNWSTLKNVLINHNFVIV